MTQAWWKDVFRGLFGMLDGVIYGLISTAYSLLNEIAHFRVFNDTTLQEISTRIYAIIGIIMLFKLSFSFVNYMINPDTFTDKQKGVQNIVKNIIIMFIMLILSPWIFTKLWDIQGAILDEQVLSHLVFGNVGEETKGVKYLEEECDDEYIISSSKEDAGDFISVMILRGFYQPYDDADIKKASDDKILKVCQKSTSDAKSLLTSDIYNATVSVNKSKYYVMEYNFGISTAVGVVVLLLMVNFCIDVGTRMVKLSFLQLIAPIPIISYIDPASGKNGMFQKWLKEVGKTWISVFIKLLAIFFAVSIIQHVGDLDSIGKDREAGVWIQIFVIIGALIFAKQLPDLIQNITGIKMEGGFNLNPFKKIENEALGGKVIASVPKKTFGAVRGGVGGAIAGIKAGKEVNRPFLGFGMGFTSGFIGGFKNDKGAFSGQMREQYKNLTGNEMARLTPGRLLLQYPGKSAVKEVKDHMNDAYTLLDQKQTKLNTVQTTSSEVGTRLRRKGVDISNIDKAKSDINDMKIANSAKKTEMQTVFNDKKREYDAQKGVVSQKQQTFNQNKIEKERELETKRESTNESKVQRVKDFESKREDINEKIGAIGNEKKEYEKAKAVLKAGPTYVEIGEDRDYSDQYKNAQALVQKFEKDDGKYQKELDQSEAKYKLDIEQEEEKMNNDIAQLQAALEQEEEKVKEYISKEQEEISQEEEKLAKADEELKQAEEKVSDVAAEEAKIDETEQELELYEKSVQEENQLRKEISKVNKDIETLRKEKSEREQFYGVSSADKNSYSDAIKDIKKLKGEANSEETTEENNN